MSQMTASSEIPYDGIESSKRGIIEGIVSNVRGLISKIFTKEETEIVDFNKLSIEDLLSHEDINLAQIMNLGSSKKTELSVYILKQRLLDEAKVLEKFQDSKEFLATFIWRFAFFGQLGEIEEVNGLNSEDIKYFKQFDF